MSCRNSPDTLNSPKMKPIFIPFDPQPVRQNRLVEIVQLRYTNRPVLIQTATVYLIQTATV